MTTWKMADPEFPDDVFIITTRQDIRTLWHDIENSIGEHVASFPDLESARQYILGDYPETDSDSLGPCGCTDYHMADCGLVTG